MSNSKQIIIDEIKQYIQKGGGDYSDWYVGVGNAEDMFYVHKAKGHAWMYKQVSSTNSAKKIRNYFVNILCMDGDVHDGNDSANIVYVYKKKALTV